MLEQGKNTAKFFNRQSFQDQVVYDFKTPDQFIMVGDYSVTVSGVYVVDSSVLCVYFLVCMCSYMCICVCVCMCVYSMCVHMLCVYSHVRKRERELKCVFVFVCVFQWCFCLLGCVCGVFTHALVLVSWMEYGLMHRDCEPSTGARYSSHVRETVLSVRQVRGHRQVLSSQGVGELRR